MKKLFSILLVVLMLTSLLASCGASANTNTETDTNTESNVNTDNTNTDTNTDSNVGTGNTNTDSNTNIDNVEPVLCEKYGDNVYFTFEEKENNYYSAIIDYVETDTPVEFPSEGEYIKVITTYEELLSHISVQGVEANLFDVNYVVCIKTEFVTNPTNNFKFIGFYDLDCKDGKYEISYDNYESNIALAYKLEAVSRSQVSYLVVPKHEVVFKEGVQALQTKQCEVSSESSWFISCNNNENLPKKPASWVMEKDSALEKSYGLGISNIIENQFRVVLYLPDEPTCDFIITEKEIKKGDLFITIEAYTQQTNEFLNKNDINFYDLHIDDSSLLSDDYNVFITVKKVNPPFANEKSIVSEGEAVMIAQEHFFNTYYENLNNECYYAKEVYSMLDEDRIEYPTIPDADFNVEDIMYVVHIYPREANPDDLLSRYIYYISKTGLVLYVAE